MGERARVARHATQRRIRRNPLTASERDFLRANAVYEGSPRHKRNPGDFGLTPPASPRVDRTLCDEAGITRRQEAMALFERAIEVGIASETYAESGFPSQLWAVDSQGRVFEAIYGGSRRGCYHGYPIRRQDPLCARVLEAWRRTP